jgi:hypothetical protein
MLPFPHRCYCAITGFAAKFDVRLVLRVRQCVTTMRHWECGGRRAPAVIASRCLTGLSSVDGFSL